MSGLAGVVIGRIGHRRHHREEGMAARGKCSSRPGVGRI
jgi:hypothetical protein